MTLLLRFTFPGHRADLASHQHDALPRNPVRSFKTFTQAANENADSRVTAGIHFRFSTNRGKALGRTVGSYIVNHHLQRR